MSEIKFINCDFSDYRGRMYHTDSEGNFIEGPRRRIQPFLWISLGMAGQGFLIALALRFG